MIFYVERLLDIFLERLHDLVMESLSVFFVLLRSFVIICLKRLHDFLCDKVA